MAAQQTTHNFSGFPFRQRRPIYDFRQSTMNITAKVYGLIRHQKLDEAVEFLEHLVATGVPENGAMLSLLGYLYFHTEDYNKATECYGRLSKLLPHQVEYRLYHAQALVKSGQYRAAEKVCRAIEIEKAKSKAYFILAGIAYERKDFVEARAFLDLCPQDSRDVKINYACLNYQEGNYVEARNILRSLDAGHTKDSQILYGLAVCNYKLGDVVICLKFIANIIDRASRKHPELNIGISTEGVQVASVGNPKKLHEVAIIEAFNLKAAIEYNMSNYEGARDALTDMPPRMESELDHVSLHNTALVNVALVDISQHSVFFVVDGLEKLQFLLEQPDFPYETFANLLLLYIKYEHYDLAADILASHYLLSQTHLSKSLKEYIEAALLIPEAPHAAYMKLEKLARDQEENLRQLIDGHLPKPSEPYEDCLEFFVAVLMLLGKILWDKEKYREVERLFHQSYLLCKNHKKWQLNSAHVLFAQGNKYKQAAELYASIVESNYKEILKIPAAVLANLCVSYVMTSRNEIAEDLMRKVEKEEEEFSFENPDRKVYHLSIINIVIGTLYCVKGNYEFGISRIMKGVVPLSKKLGTETWFYIKRSFIALFEAMAHQLIMVSDPTLQECLVFLTQCADIGVNLKANEESPVEIPKHKGINTITYEARILKALLVQLL